MEIYVGSFELEGAGQTLAFEAGEGGLYVTFGDQAPARLMFQGEHLFRLEPSPDVRLQFTVVGDQAVSITMQAGERTFSARRKD